MRMKGLGLHLEKCKRDEMTSFVVTRTNLVPSFRSLTHTEGGMASVDSESAFSFDLHHHSYWCTRRRDHKIVCIGTTIIKLPKTEWECPERRNFESVCRSVG